MRLGSQALIGLFLFSLFSVVGFADDEILPSLKNGEKPAAVELGGLDESKKDITELVAAVADKNHKYTVVELFQPYCYACRQNIVFHLPELLKKSAATTTYKLIALRNPNYHTKDEFTREVEDFLDQKPGDLIPDATEEQKARMPDELPSVRVLVDLDGKAMRAFKVQYTPTLYVLNRDGKVVYGHVGSLEGQEASKKKLLQILSP